jgi:hypothetical protein
MKEVYVSIAMAETRRMTVSEVFTDCRAGLTREVERSATASREVLI